MPDRTAAFGFRIDPQLKDALERAAEADSRSVSSLVIKILTDWAKSNGYLQDKPKKR
jgi:predicted HicB family RNase H-like nuclease